MRNFDEDSFVFPAAWQRHRHARRGSAGLTAFVPDPAARNTVDSLLLHTPGRVRTILDAPTTDPAVAAAGLAWREGRPDASPVGAAAASVAAFNWRRRDEMVAFADVWIAERGLRFAAEATVAAMQLTVTDDAATGPRSVADDKPGVRFLRPGETRGGWYEDHVVQIAFRIRAALAVAPEDEHAEVIRALADLRQGHPYARLATSLLAPDQHAWVEEDVAAAVADQDTYRASALTASAGTTAQAEALATAVGGHAYLVVSSLAMLTTLIEGVGPGAAGALFHWLDDPQYDAEIRRRLLGLLSVLPGDDVMTGLVRRAAAKYVTPALLEAAGRFPARAMRILAVHAADPVVADLLQGHVLTHPELADAVLTELEAEAAGQVEAIVEAAATLVVAPQSAVPPVLADPPWLRRGKAAKPVVVAGLECTDAPAVHWLPGEREAWRDTRFYRHTWEREQLQGKWTAIMQRLRGHRWAWNEGPTFLLEAPPQIVLPLLREWQPRETWEAGNWFRPVADRFEVEALPLALGLARRAPAEMIPALLPYTAPEIAILMADAFARLKRVRPAALSWLLRHPAAAARALVPAALQKPGTGRRQAENALFLLHANGHTETVREAAAGYGPEASAAVGVLLATDPLTVLPAKVPPVPVWAVPALLPPVQLRDGSGALPAEAVGHLVTMLSVSRLDEPYAGLAIVKEACEPASLAEFGRGLFRRWMSSGAAGKEGWALEALGLVGDDETVRRLAPQILTWPGDGGHARAVTGVDVLAAIGTDVALMHLHGIAQRAKFKGLKSAAARKMDEVATGLGLSAEQLADRLVPDFGLTAEGSLRLDYGPRQFTVGFDEQLRPYVADDTGKRLKALPKPGVRDDAELAPAASKAFAALKKDVRTVAADQIRRLERAMVTGRRWSGAEFRQLFVGHPLLWHIVRRLVWARFDEAGAVVGALRVAEDRSFTTVADDEFVLADDDLVGVAHPLHLGADLPAWTELFADYEILQPFPQLSRSTFTLTPEEAAGTRLTRFENVTLPTTKLLGLERRGWRREAPQDAGMQSRFELELGPALELAVDLDPGIAIGDPTVFPEQRLDAVLLHDRTGRRWGPGRNGEVPLGKLDPVSASEILRDLTEITA